ncbi:MAG: glycoside hydrolase family 3 C-terminal domain-containing protein [Micromonosporaceae bacterium]
MKDRSLATGHVGDRIGRRRLRRRTRSRALRLTIATTLAATAVGLTTGLSAPRPTAAHAAARAQAAADTPIYLDKSYSFTERAADLVSRMTLAEKASQAVSSKAPAIPRLGIQSYGWWNEALHGVSRLQYNPTGNATTLSNTTSYPISLALGSSWDPSLMYSEASLISDEAREVAPDNSLNLDFYSPTINLEHDPRWGRNDETYSEDPLLTADIAAQFVDGMEGKSPGGSLLRQGGGYLKTITTIKHYAANNSEVNRLTGSSDMDDRTLREYYTDTFRQIIQQAQPGSIMSAYNSVNGVPSAANVYLMDTLARETFGFQGYTTSDCDAIFKIVDGHHWQPPGYSRPVNNTERHAFAMSAGEDLDCNAGYRDAYNYLNSLPAAANEGIPTQTDTFNANDIDTSLVRLFTARMQLGEFDNFASEPWVAAARSRVPEGTWTNSDANNAVTETDARLAAAREIGDKSIVLLKNSPTTRNDGTTGSVLPLKVPSTGPFKVAVIGYFANPASMYLGGYASNQGAPGVAKEVNGYQGIKSAIQAINPGAQVDFYKGFTDTGTTAASLQHVDQAAVDAAANYDDVIVYVGTDPSTATEAGDRSTLDLPGAQASLISQVAAKNPNTVAYMETMGEVNVTGFEPGVHAMLWSSYNGQRKGDSLADVLLGNYNPSARLPFTWYRDDSELPPITDYNIRPTATDPGRTYMYWGGPVSYPFGYGLSYASFKYSNLRIDKTGLNAGGAFHVSADVTNTSSVPGDQVTELYVNTPDAPAALQRPIKRLEGFTHVSLSPGQTKRVIFTVKVPNLAFFNSDLGRWAVDNGRYGIQIATSSADSDIQLQRFIHVSGSLPAVPSVVTVQPAMRGDAARDIATRVMYPEGAVVVPKVTVAMNDDTLYGYVTKGQSKPFPPGMSLAYRSNRQSVVSVGRNGVIRTVGNGVATITATATYHGVSKSASFVVRVLSELSNLTVNGRPVSGFHPDTYAYDVILPDAAAPPRVAATTPDHSATVSVTQPASVPGSATADVTGPDGITQTYTIYFAYRARGDEFSGATLAPQWSWVRQDPANESLTTTPGSLVITPEQGDLTGTTNTAKNLLLQPALGNWTIESKLVFSAAPHANNQQAGIIAYADDNNYLKLDWEFSFGTARLAETTEDSLSGAPVTQVLATLPTAGIIGDSQTVWLRMTKIGPRYTTYYSTDGVNFTPFYTTGAPLQNARVGLFAFNRAGTNSDLSVAYDYFHVTNTPPHP